MTFVAKFKIKKQNPLKAIFSIGFKPTKVSQLENDLHFQTEEDVASTVQSAVEEVTIETDAKITEVNQTINNLSQTVEDNYLDLDNKITVNHQELTTEITEVNQTINNLSQTVEDNYLDLDNKITVNHQELDNHTSNKNNPHEVTKTQIGLDNVDNTSDLDKPVSNATHIALDTKVDKTSIANRVYGTDENGNQTTYSYETFGKVDDVRVDGISVVTDKIANLGSMANENSNDYSTTAEANSLYAEKSLETTVSNHVSNKNNPHEVTKTQIGLSNVDNTSDLNKPISTATQNALDTLSNTVSSNYTTLNTRITNETATLNTAIITEETNRQNADNNLQSQIDAITSASDVTDIVGTYAQLQAYDTSTLPPNSIIKVLQDEHQNNETTYYRWVITGGVDSWVLIGEEGPYYTKSEADGKFVPQTRTVNGKALSTNITLDASDVGALPSSTVIPVVDQMFDGTSTNAQSGVAINDELTTHYVKSSAEDTSQGITSSIGYVNDIYPTMQITQGNYQFVITTEEGASLGAIDNTTNSAVAFGATPDGVGIVQGTQQALLTLSSNNNLAVNGSEVILRTDIDSSLSTTSENPVQNKAIAQAIENITLAKNPNLNLIGRNLNIDNGNVSNFSITDYMQFPFVFNFNGYTWTLEMSFTTGSDVTTQQNILDSYYGVAFAINNGKFLMALSSNGSSWDIGSNSGAYSVQANTAYSVKIAWDGSNYTSSYALDETNYTTDISIASTETHHSTQEYVGGEPELFGSGSQHPFTGTINLNKWKLIVNGLEVWLGMDDVGLGSRANIDLSNLTEAGLAKFQTPLVSGTNIKTINNESILGSGNIEIQAGGTVEEHYDPNSTNAQAGTAVAEAIEDTRTWVQNQGYISVLPTNLVTTNTAQNITAKKTFIGEKAIYFKQTANTDKLGFTLYNSSDTELGALEWRPNTISGNALLALNCPQSGNNYVGFRYWSNINIIAPRPTTNGSYFIPVNVTDGTNTVTANNNGILNISTLLPDVSNFVTNSSLATTLADYQPLLVSGTNIKSINNTSLLGSGNIDIDSLPTQTGNNGKFLTTNGTTASWADTTKVTFRDWSVA